MRRFFKRLLNQTLFTLVEIAFYVGAFQGICLYFKGAVFKSEIVFEHVFE